MLVLCNVRLQSYFTGAYIQGELTATSMIQLGQGLYIKVCRV